MNAYLLKRAIKRDSRLYLHRTSQQTTPIVLRIDMGAEDRPVDPDDKKKTEALISRFIFQELLNQGMHHIKDEPSYGN